MLARRELVNVLLDVLRNGISWRVLPHESPPWQTVSHSGRRWRADGPFAQMNAVLRPQVRVTAGRDSAPRAGSIDRQRSSARA